VFTTVARLLLASVKLDLILDALDEGGKLFRNKTLVGNATGCYTKYPSLTGYINNTVT